MADTAAKTVGARLRTIRLQRGWSLTQAAEELGCVRPQTLGNYETAARAMTIVKLAEIAAAYNVPTTYFVTGITSTAERSTQ